MNDESDLPVGSEDHGSAVGPDHDRRDEASNEPLAHAPVAHRPGARLRSAREALNLSLEDVALQLKVASRKVAALEEEQWHEMPERPYLRGLVRNYARVLHIDAEQILADIDRERGGVEAPGAFSLTPGLRAPFPQRTPGVHDSPTSRLMMIGVVICAAVICFIVFSRTSWFASVEELFLAALHSSSAAKPPEAVDSGDGARLNLTGQLTRPDSPQAQPDRPADLPTPLPAPTVVSPPQAARDQVASAVSQTPSVAARIPAAQTGGSALVMQFKDDSWVEMRGADGKVSSQLYRAGTEETLDVKPPVEVVIGNAPVVTLTYQGRQLDLEPYTRARVARLNLP